MKKVFLLALAIVATLSLAAQNNQPANMKLQKSKMEKAKVWMNKKQEQRKAFLISKMELNDTERVAFVAIYDTYRAAHDKSTSLIRRTTRQMNDSCTNEQYEKYLETINNEKITQAKLDSEFYQSMKKALSPRQIYLFYKADKDFNKLMMRDMHKKDMKRRK